MSALAAGGELGSRVETTGGVFQLRGDEPASRVVAGRKTSHASGLLLLSFIQKG